MAQGCSIVYSHRIYGEKIGDQMSAWLSENGAEDRERADAMERDSVAESVQRGAALNEDAVTSRA